MQLLLTLFKCDFIAKTSLCQALKFPPIAQGQGSRSNKMLFIVILKLMNTTHHIVFGPSVYIMGIQSLKHEQYNSI